MLAGDYGSQEDVKREEDRGGRQGHTERARWQDVPTCSLRANDIVETVLSSMRGPKCARRRKEMREIQTVSGPFWLEVAAQAS